MPISALDLAKYCTNRNLKPVADVNFKKGAIRVLAGEKGNTIDVFEKIGDEFVAKKGYSGSNSFKHFKNWLNELRKDVVSGKLFQ